MKGNVYAIVSHGKSREVFVVAADLQMPVGVCFHNKDLYISAVSKIIKLENIESRLKNPPEPEIVNDTFPTDTWHGWKFIKFGPDGKLYVPQGMPCNVCEKEDKRYGTIFRMNENGSGLEIFESGIRNTVGFDWHPVTKELWFTDNGRDYMGDNIPPDELNYAPVKGMNFGFPYIVGNNIKDPVFGINKNPADYAKSAIDLGPHVAPLGMRFYTGKMFPEKYKNNIFIAEHGSWNRTIPIGYRVTFVTIKNNKEAVNYEVFAEGWLQNGKAWGRPADVEVMEDGSLLVSDDFAGAVYRIYYTGAK